MEKKIGLDSYIFSEDILSDKEEVLNKLEEIKNERKEELYWRKHYEIVDFFNDWNGEEIENCEDFIITLGCLLDFLEFLETNEQEEDDGYNYYSKYHKQRIEDIIKVKDLIDNTDFNKTKLYFYSWW